jgi:hypothetical protein
MTKQVVYAAERAGALMPRDGPARVKFLVNTRGGGFRVPDADYRAAVFEVLHPYYPWLENCRVILFFLFPFFYTIMYFIYFSSFCSFSFQIRAPLTHLCLPPCLPPSSTR